jgi:CheY-like chemotaxis protein
MKWELLLIDDEQCILESLAELLTEDDIIVTTARNGVEGLSLLKEKHFDVVVTDLSMPKMDGHQMFVQARADGICVPVIFFSASANPIEIQALKNAGAQAVVMKPHFERLSVEINSVLNKNQFMFAKEYELEFYQE